LTTKAYLEGRRKNRSYQSIKQNDESKVKKQLENEKISKAQPNKE
jgi:hypothetical protein